MISSTVDRQQAPLATLLELGVEISGAEVLEVGGGAHLTCPREMVIHGAESVLVTNVGHGLEECSEGNIQTKMHSALEIESLNQEFDIIFGVSVLEHIPDPVRLFSQVANCLKKGGHVFFSGGPLWSSARGHHCWLTIDDAVYEFTMPGINDIIEPFDHLIYDQQQLSDKLEPTIGKSHAEKLSEHVFHAPHINRETHGSIMNAIQQCGLTIKYFMSRTYFFENPKYMNRIVELREQFDDNTDPAIMGFDIVLQKIS